MSPAPASTNNRRSKNDTQITCADNDQENKDEKGKSSSVSSEVIPLNSARTASYEDEESEKIRRIFVTGCSCTESMKKMWTQLQLLEEPAVTVPKVALSLIEQDETDTVLRRNTISIPNPPHGLADVTDQIASTTELISTLRCRQSVPNKDVQKEAAILRSHWSRLVQKEPKGKTLLLCRAIQKKPLILNPFLEMLSECVYFVPPSGKESEGLEDETTIHMDMKDLLECPGGSAEEFREAQVLVHLVEGIEDMDVKDKILSHPLITTFATLKYQKYQFVSVMLLVYHLLFAILFTNYAFHAFLWEHPPASIAIVTKCASVVLTFMALLSAIKTITTFFASGLQFDLTTTRRIGEIFCACVAVFMCLLPSFGFQFPFSRSSENKDVTAFGVMTSWLILLSYLTKFNQTAVYVQTFFQIVKNYIHFLWMVAICQLIALSAAYSLIFHKTEYEISLTGNFSRSFIRVLTGRMNYDDYTGAKADLENPLSVFNYLVLFFVLSTVMMAMIIGLAQNGLADTRSASAVNVLCQVIKDIAELEWIFGKLKTILPRKLSEWLVRKISIKDYLVTGKTVLEFRPHDPSNEKIPVSLKKSIYNHLMDRGATCHR